MKLQGLCYVYAFTILSGLLSLLLPAELQAQIRVGPKAGFQLGRSVFEDNDYRQQFTSSFKPGILAGAVLNYRVSRVYSLHTELFYNQKGKNVKSRRFDEGFVQNTATYHYLDMPVLLRISTHKIMGKQKAELYLNIGPSFNYWLGGTGSLRNTELLTYYDKSVMDYVVRFNEEGNGAGQELDLYVRNGNRLQLSLDFGGGVLLDLGRGHAVMIDFRNSLGVGKSFMGEMESGEFGLQTYNDNFEAVNHVFALSVGYLIDIDVPAFLMKGKIRR